MRIRSVIVAGALAMHAMPGVAQEVARGSGFYVAPIVNAVFTDNDRAVDDEAAFTFAAGLEAHRNWNFELNLFRGSFNSDTGNDLDLDAAGVNALRVFRRDARVAPYLLLGLGAQRSDRQISGSSTDAYADAGAGLLMTLRKSRDDGRALLLRFDARARHEDSDGNPLEYLLGIGLQYAFGSRPSERMSMPSTSIASSTVAAPPPADEDGDGVIDDQDRCPNTPQGKAVGPDGCELDSDGDGALNTTDDCPRTPSGTRVDARGCELKDEIRLPLVTFEHDSDRLKPEAFATLDQAAETLRRNPDLRVEVAGHTDSRGSDAYNLQLSQRRAEAVRRHLSEKGVKNTLTARGYGEREPVVDNNTEAGRSENRRVVLRIFP
jgi:OmpA-OmpF porin, OOP family